MPKTAELEKHYTPNEIAEKIGLSPRTVRRMFQDEPGVLRLGSSFRPKTRGYVSMRIPESVLNRVCDSMRVHRSRVS